VVNLQNLAEFQNLKIRNASGPRFDLGEGFPAQIPAGKLSPCHQLGLTSSALHSQFADLRPDYIHFAPFLHENLTLLAAEV
jgi:hypothetical protein